MGVVLDTRYQTEAYDAIQSSIKETGKAGIVLPTGTGKTYLALKLIEDNLDKDQILYVSPSPTINVQVRKLIRQTYPEEEAKRILSKVKFVTYSGLDKRFKHSKHDMREYNSDVIILDEVHRSGAQDWGKAVDYLLETNSNAQILGMTATPLRNDGQNMIEKRFGKTAYELKLSEAVARGILTLPTYISSRYIFDEDIQDLQTKIDSIENQNEKEEFQKKLNKLRKQVADAKGIKGIISKHINKKNGKYLLFCNPGDNIEELQAQARQEGWFDEINENQTFLTVESTRTDSENYMALRRFERKGGEDLRVLYSKNMLNEGIHDEEISGEIMLRPTKSYILFTQQLGRILSKDRPEAPLVLDLVGNIRYFKEFRLEIQSIINEGIKRGDKRYSEKTLEQFRIFEEQEDFIQAFEEIEASIEKYMNKTAIEETLDILEALKAEGIDVTKIQRTIKENGRDRSTYLYEIRHENIEKIIKKLSLDREYPIGTKISSMLAAYKRKNSYKINELDRKRIEELGLIKVKSSIEETLDILEALKAEGVDVTKIQKFITENGKERSLFLYEIQDENIEGIIEKLELDREYPIGLRIKNMLTICRAKNRSQIGETDRKRIEALGMRVFKEKSSIEETLDILEALKVEGIDVTKIQRYIRENGKQRYTYLYEIQDVNIEKIIKKLSLDREYPIGTKIRSMLDAYEGIGKHRITKSDRKRIEALGMIAFKEKSSIEETLDILEVLKTEGIDVTKIQRYITENGQQRYTYLYEIKDINIEEIIKKLSLDRKYPIGTKISSMLDAYKGIGKHTITKSDRKRIEALGLRVFKEKSSIEETLDILEALKVEGIDVTKIQRHITENGKQRSTYLYEVQYENIEGIIQKLDLNRGYPIGRKIKTMLEAYKGSATLTITGADIERIESLGLVSELDKKEAEQRRLRKKQAKTKRLKAQVKQELDKQNVDKDIGDTDE